MVSLNPEIDFINGFIYNVFTDTGFPKNYYLFPLSFNSINNESNINESIIIEYIINESNINESIINKSIINESNIDESIIN